MSGQRNLCLMIGAALLAGVLIYWYVNRKEKFTTKKENYMAAGAMDHLDSLDSRYNLIEGADEAVPAEHFADIVDNGDQARFVQQRDNADEMRPLERLEKLQNKSMLPSTAAHLPQYNIDVANPASYAFATQAPRVVLKNRLNMQADMIRGDIPVRYFPDVPLITKSQYGRDSWRGDGFFSDHFSHLYNRLTGSSYKSMPLKVATQGTVADYIQA